MNLLLLASLLSAPDLALTVGTGPNSPFAAAGAGLEIRTDLRPGYQIGLVAGFGWPASTNPVAQVCRDCDPIDVDHQGPTPLRLSLGLALQRALGPDILVRGQAALLRNPGGTQSNGPGAADGPFYERRFPTAWAWQSELGIEWHLTKHLFWRNSIGWAQTFHTTDTPTRYGWLPEENAPNSYADAGQNPQGMTMSSALGWLL